ncbi:hypothetical protein [Phytoactinopolyspora limicola]|uniref:hypothetical protein n=1 Tax=Phytoactinopolyspora limicola TaxID=2715536 RepID=UPI00140821F6|nr:hypothetical protein [Phytoactinopolyspora limicola]
MDNPRHLRIQKLAGYGAAMAMLPYLLIKIVWTVDGLRGGGLDDGVWEELDWTQVNALTVAMAAVAVILGLMLAQDWGRRVPTWVIALPAWVGMGFLTPLLAVVAVPFTESVEEATTEVAGELPLWEMVLITISFAGTGLGLAIAFPLYARRRWPEAFVGMAGMAGMAGEQETSATAAARPRPVVLARAAMALCVALGVGQLYWALGGTAGLEFAELQLRDARWHVFTANSGLWALIAAWGVWTLTRRRGRLPIWIPMLAAWVASGSLSAWGAWKGIFTALVPPETPEHPFALAAVNLSGLVAGVLAGLTLLLVLRVRRAAGIPLGA